MDKKTETDCGQIIYNCTTEEAMSIVTNAISNDKEYYNSWFASISMAMQDNGCNNDIADKGATTFLEWLTR